MARSILDASFADSAARLPVWSGLAEPVKGNTVPEQIAELDIVFTEVPLALADTGESIASHKAITVSSRSNPAARHCIAITSAEYNTLLAQDDGEIVQRYMRRPADAIGAMGGGNGLWMLFVLGKMYIKNDETDLNLLYVSPKTGQGAVMVRLQPLRIICSNAITMSGHTAVSTYRAVHDSHVKDRTALWLEHVVAQLPLRKRLLHDEFTALSDTLVPDDVARRILADVYADPPQPAQDAPEDVMRERIESWEQRRKRLVERRETALNLYQGQGTGMDADACKGSAYGLLAAVTELEDWSRAHSAQTRGESSMFGQRAAVKSRCFSLLLNLAQSR